LQIAALTDIVEGKLQNTPAISFITQIHTNIAKVNEGDAFFVQNSSQIQKAIEKNAFAVIYQHDLQITDNEIAWIQVDNLEKSLANILRYKLLEYDHRYIHTNRFFLDLLRIFKSKELQHVLTLGDDIYKNFELLNTIDTNKLIFSTDEKFLHNITAEIFTLEDTKFNLQNLTVHSLFETSFSYKERYFDRIKLPRVYVDYLLQVLELFEYTLDLKKLNSFKHFQPLFINKSNQIAPFGQTNRFILASMDKDIYTIEIAYLQEYYSYAEIVIQEGKGLSENEIYSIIQKENFNALYLKNYKIENIIKILQDYDHQGILF
jgi:hypothetical protein